VWLRREPPHPRDRRSCHAAASLPQKEDARTDEALFSPRYTFRMTPLECAPSGLLLDDALLRGCCTLQTGVRGSVAGLVPICRLVDTDRSRSVRMTPLGSNRPWPLPLFQMPTTSLWNTAAASGRPSPVLSPQTSQSDDITTLGGVTGVPCPGRILSWDGGVAGSARTGCRPSCPPCRSRNPACNGTGRLASAPESVPVKTLLRRPAHATEMATPDSGDPYPILE